MKKQIFTISLLVLFSASYAQENLRTILSGERGISQHFTALDKNQQVSFNPSNARSIFGLNANSDLILRSTEKDKTGVVHYRFYQTYKGIPVENAMYIAHTENGVLTSMSGSIVTDFDTKMDKSSSSLTDAKAIEAALNYMHAEKYAWQDASFEQHIKLRNGKDATYYPTSAKVWYSGEDEIDPAGLRLAYKIDVYSIKPVDRKYVYVDAQSGKILGTEQIIKHTDAIGTAQTIYSGPQTIHSDYTGTNYRLRDYTKGKGVLTLHAVGSHADYTSPSANFSYSNADKWALDAHFGVAATWTYYKNNFNRNSVDNNGYALVSWVNDPNTPDNAYWDGSEMDFGNLSSNGNGVVAIDITGHELTHGVTQYTSALIYSKEPGAMNESMSDIMGKSVQFYTKPNDINWILSNDMNWNIRSFSNPNADGQPDTYKGTYWYTGSFDNYGVHTNSGVGNFMFYLLVNGGSGTNDIHNAYSVTGIGLAKADQILYLTNTSYLTPTSQYIDWRVACINAATALYGASSNEVIQVKNAWYAVGVGTSGGSGTCTAPSALATTGVTTTSATLTWGAVTGAQSYTLQWKPSSATTWTTVTGLTTASYNLTGLTPATSYQFQVLTVCGSTSSSPYSSSFTFTTSSASTSYCASKGTSTAYEYINRVAIGTRGITSGNNGGYKDYTNLSTAFTAGTAYSITLTPGFTGSARTEYWSVYVDYDLDKTFTGPGELVATGSNTSAITLTFTVPLTTKNGAARMRVQMSYGSPTTNPCATINYGEVEDYTANITGGTGFAPSSSFAASSFGLASEMDAKSGLTIAPNPVKGSVVNTYYNLATEGKVRLQIIDLNGRLLHNADLGYQTAGAHRYNLGNLNNLSAGNYILILEQNSKVIERKHFMVGK